MSKYAGQRRATKRRTVPGLAWVAIAVPAGLVAITAFAVVASPDEGADDRVASASALATDATKGRPRRVCTDPTTVAVPAAYVAAWTHVAAGFQPNHDCRSLAIVAVPSAAFALGKAPVVDAWIPEDRSWIGRSAKEVWSTRPPAVAQLARTPLVVATSSRLDQAVGGVQELLTPAAFGPLVRDTKTFADLGAPAAGDLRVALPDPNSSATGGLGFAALVRAATGKPLTSAPAYVDPTTTDLTTIKTEHRVVSVHADELAALDALDPADETGANLCVTTEQAALARSQTDPDDALAVGYLGVDLDMAVVAVAPAAQSTVDEFAAFARSPEGATALTEAGLRPSNGAGTPAAVAGIDPAVHPEAGITFSADQVSGLAFLYTTMHQRFSTLVLLDASGSMLQPLPGSDISKIDLVRRAARDTLEVASPRARTGLMTFHSAVDDTPVINTRVPMGTNGERSQARLHSTAIRNAVDDLRPHGGTPLYNAVRDAYREAQASFDPTMLNQIVVLSDGRNEDARGSISLPELVQTLRSDTDPKRPVRIIAIGYGPDADMAALNKIVDATSGRASWLRTVEGYSDAVQEALFAI